MITIRKNQVNEIVFNILHANKYESKEYKFIFDDGTNIILNDSSLYPHHHSLFTLKEGKTNMLLDSKIESENDLVGNINLAFAPKVGTKYTLIFEGNLGDDREYWSIYNSGNKVPLIEKIESVSNSTRIISKEFIWKDTYNDTHVDDTFISFYVKPDGKKGKSLVNWAMLFEGTKNIPTVYEPYIKESLVMPIGQGICELWHTNKDDQDVFIEKHLYQVIGDTPKDEKLIEYDNDIVKLNI